MSAEERNTAEQHSARQVWAAMRAMYAGFIAGDAAAVDALLHPAVTLWDSAEFELVHGLAELADLRRRRPADPSRPSVIKIEPSDPVIEIWDDTALLRHLLDVEFSDGTRQLVRNTSVWRRCDGRWQAVHNHEDVAGGARHRDARRARLIGKRARPLV